MEVIEEREMEYEEWRKLKSIVHEHRLVVDDQEEHHNNDEWYCCCSFCKVCDQPITRGGPHHKYYLYYYCCKGCDFFLHKSCAELPLTFAHPLHKFCNGLVKFKINLHEWRFDVPLGSNRRALIPKRCFSCCRDNQGFGYHCSSWCGFNLDFPCALAALLQPTIAFGRHEHRFTLWTKQALFTCDACGTTHHDKGFFYMCTECQLWVHQDCATSLPNTIKHNAHIHPLTLKCYFPVPREYRFNRLCEICSGDTRSERLLYNCCEGCSFAVHVNCAKSKTQQESSRDDKIDTELIKYQEATHLPVEDISIHLVTQFFKKKISLRQEENQTSGAMEEEIKHFSHEHPLTLFDQAVISSTTSSSSNKDGDLMRCQACTRPISEYHPFYSCTKCKYFIHKSCSELPTEIMNHPFHPCHTLALVHKTPYVSNFFMCDACQKRCNGFAFHCASCEFDLDLTCSSISGTIIHEAHKHPLVCRWYKYIICNACNLPCEQGLVFGCVTCGFSLDIKCALLPRTVRNGQRDEHPLTLSYCLSINESEEYLCDTCEKDVDPQSWFYYCAECDDPLHPECISSFNGESNILFGNKVDIKGHPHPLTVTRMTRDKPPCDKCGKPCTDISFHCEECKFNLDGNCAHKIHKISQETQDPKDCWDFLGQLQQEAS